MPPTFCSPLGIKEKCIRKIIIKEKNNQITVINILRAATANHVKCMRNPIAVMHSHFDRIREKVKIAKKKNTIVGACNVTFSLFKNAIESIYPKKKKTDSVISLRNTVILF